MNDLPFPLIDAPTLRQRLASGAAMHVVDCSFDLADPAAGRAQYRAGHIPGARYAHLDDDLSAAAGDPTAASGGRHPLPARDTLAERLRRWGLNPDEPVVVYDRQGGMVCGRLWWMLRWCGHGPVAVLDGGWAAWQAMGGPVETGDGPATPAPGHFALAPARVVLRTVHEVANALGRPQQTLIDARATPRFRGEVEPLDPVAGHIPGALNRPFGDNFDADGRYKSPERLRAEFATLLAGRDPNTVVHHCGSGVSAIPNLLAMTIAGLGTAPLFAGGWSEWCRTPGLPCARS
ncbi:putative thiosulfate sulfurtransferase SseB [Tepidimonas thermarum]|uniref:Sulfurtransferase n=1 Tax=Tepidimonas thermarum TaxID=335431 RepID=A0A554WZF3_9BURK|nr:sulfurtransferase [Tepidimonas thermarum]TSE28957.1 putative thiosulfate sulfurtransferase SseB [Tepidimonas thermarum]